MKDKCLSNLSQAIDLIMEDRREDALRGIPADASREMVSVPDPH
jgi:predicted RNase H-like HicB family nuclease